MRVVSALCLSSALALAQAPVVVSTSPTRHAFAGPFDPIRVVFAAPIAPATVTAHSFAVFGRWTGAVAGTITVNATGTAVTFQPAAPLFAGDFVRVDLASSITSAGNTPMPGGYHFEYTVRSGPGSGVFVQTQTIPFRMANEGWIGTYGIHAGDVDRDGSPDMTAINEVSGDLRVFRNSGCASFGSMSLAPLWGNAASPHDSADFNRDGWLDVVTGAYNTGNVLVSINNGAGGFLPPIVLVGNTYIRSVVTGDFDADGYPDIVAGNGTTTLVWRNNGSIGGFAGPVGYATYASAELEVADANEDGNLDVVGCDLSPAHTWVLLGNGNGGFAQGTLHTPIGAQPFQSAHGDVNGDGHVDVVYCCHNPESFVWLLGDGNGSFTPAGSLPAGPGPTSVHLADLDGDGDLDAVLSHYIAANVYVYMNLGGTGFALPFVLPMPSGASCTTLADFDRDGDLDILAADEILDVGVLFAQSNTPPPGLQPFDCSGALRVDQRADFAGWVGAPVPVRVGAPTAVNLSGPDGPALGAAFLGFPSPIGIPLAPWGLVHLDPFLPFVSVGAALLDVHGEMQVVVQLPGNAPLGATLAVQGLVLTPAGERLTNPMQFTLVP
jgi:hypothetical protein